MQLAVYPLFTFTDWHVEEEQRVQAGWVLVAIITMNILFNILFASVYAVKSCRLKHKRFKLRRAHAQLVKERLKKLEEARKRELELKQENDKRLEVIKNLFISTKDSAE